METIRKATIPTALGPLPIIISQDGVRAVISPDLKYAATLEFNKPIPRRPFLRKALERLK